MIDAHSDTTFKISQITDAGHFEQLATRVLRSAVPLYRGIVHTGINSKGQTVTDPVDGICIVTDSSGQKHAIAVEHTITARPKLSGKWLDSTEGDLPKALNSLSLYIDGNGTYVPRIVLTCSITPSSALVKNVKQFEVDHSVEIDIWSNDRLAYELDTSADGQTIRAQFFGTPQTRLSVDFARKISQEQVFAHKPLVADEQLVVRNVEDALPGLSQHRSNLVFISGSSGMGKTSLCHQIALGVIEAGGVVLVLPHQVLSACETLDQAVHMCLNNFEPSLAVGQSLDVIAKIFQGQRIFLWVEDVNKSEAPADLISKIDRFSRSLQASQPEDGARALDISIYCPVWPQNLRGLTDEARRSVEAKAVELQRFTKFEARTAVKLISASSNVNLTDLEADKIAEKLAYDPLLISLLRGKETDTPDQMISKYVQRCLDKCARNSSHSVYSLQSAASMLAKWMVEERVQTPIMADLHLEFGNTDVFGCIEALCAEGSLLREISHGTEQSLGFRHDRFRDFLIVQAIQNEFVSGNFADDYVVDPVYVELVSQAAIGAPAPDAYWETLQETNPLGLFCALKLASRNQHNLVQPLLVRCLDFVRSGSLSGLSSSLRSAIEWQIAGLQGEEFERLIQGTLPGSHAGREARILNGDVSAAMALYRHGINGNYPYRDRLIGHAREKFGQAWLDALCSLLVSSDLVPEERENALFLSGECSETFLANAVSQCWDNMKAEGESLSYGMLYAAVSCGAGVAEFPLDKIFEAWQNLPKETSGDDDGPSRNPRYEIAKYGLSAGLRRVGNPRTIEPLLRLATRAESMRHSIYVCLDEVDHPLAATYVASYIAQIDKRIEGKKDAWNHVGSSRLWLKSEGFDWHVRFSKPSMEALEQVWSDPEQNIHDRTRHFQLWRDSMGAEGCAAIAASPPSGLEDEALIARCHYGDRSAIPALKEKLSSEDKNYYWFQLIRNFGSDGFEANILAELDKRRTIHNAGGDPDKHADFVIPELLAERDDNFSEDTILEHWCHLRDCWEYPHLLLYLATPKTLKLFAATYQESEDKEKLFQLFWSSFGIRHIGRSGLKRIEQLTALEPYLSHLEPTFISELWGECGAKGFEDWRDANLNHRIADDDYVYQFINDDAAFSKIDGELDARDNIAFAAYIWADIRDREKNDPRARIKLAKKYANSRNIPRAAEFLAEVTKIIGSREDLDDLEKYKETGLLTQTQHADACFSVRLRSLI